MKYVFLLLVLPACGGGAAGATESAEIAVTHPIPAQPAVEPVVRAFAPSHLPSALPEPPPVLAERELAQ
jgi:hypothetical protein